MKARTLVWMFWGLMLGGSVTAAGGQQWLDPGDGSATAVTRTSTARYSMELVLEAGAQAPLRPLPGECWLEVRQGEVLLTVGGRSETVRSGETRVVPAGVDFTLLNGGNVAARVMMWASLALQDAPRTYPAQTLA
jgi:quercetin dioxygenase-like cupin family protein